MRPAADPAEAPAATPRLRSARPWRLPLLGLLLAAAPVALLSVVLLSTLALDLHRLRQDLARSCELACLDLGLWPVGPAGGTPPVTG